MELDGLAQENPPSDTRPQVLRKYTWGLDLSGQSGSPSYNGVHSAGGIGGLLAVYDTLATHSTSNDKAYFYCYDANGNVCQLVDAGSSTSSNPTIAAKY